MAPEQGLSASPAGPVSPSAPEGASGALLSDRSPIQGNGEGLADRTPHASGGGQFVLPVLVFGIVEVRRLLRELEALEDFMGQTTLREPGRQPALPRLSRLCEALAQENHLNLLQAEHRKTLAAFLQQLAQTAPNIHISFASDPSSAFTAKLVAWLRANVHPYTLLEIGLQPTIAAGCIVRTTNKVFDLSLRERFANSQQLLIDALEAATATPTGRGGSHGGTPAARNEVSTVGEGLADRTPRVSEGERQITPPPQGVAA